MKNYLFLSLVLSGCLLNPYGSDSEVDCSFNNTCTGGSQTVCDEKATLTDPTEEGDGSTTPYKIYSADQLANISADITNLKDKNFELQCDINMSGTTFNPIGDSSDVYSGTFNGNNKTVSNLTISVSVDNLGFIGYANGATIQNLTISNASYTNTSGSTPGSDRGNGVVVGFAEDSTISNCHASGSISSFSYGGGLVGGTDNGTQVSASSSSVNVTCTSTSGGHGNCGGFVGTHCQLSAGTPDCKIINSYSTGSVTASTSGSATSYGGFAGNVSNSGEIEDSYSTGNVQGQDRVGGFAGTISSTSQAIGCFSTGTVTSSGSSIAVFLGRYGSSTDPTSALTNVYYFDQSGDSIDGVAWEDNDSTGTAPATEETTLSDFYNSGNEPYATSVWDTSVWTWSGSDFPTLQ